MRPRELPQEVAHGSHTGAQRATGLQTGAHVRTGAQQVGAGAQVRTGAQVTTGAGQQVRTGAQTRTGAGQHVRTGAHFGRHVCTGAQAGRHVGAGAQQAGAGAPQPRLSKPPAFADDEIAAATKTNAKLILKRLNMWETSKSDEDLDTIAKYINCEVWIKTSDVFLTLN